MSDILITGNLTRRALENALYNGWTITTFHEGTRGNVATITTSTANPDYMLGRLWSFGTIGATDTYTQADVIDALVRVGATQ